LKSAKPCALRNHGGHIYADPWRRKSPYRVIERQAGKLCFVGNMEARDFYTGKYDIIVADGFAGNVFLKTLEGTGKLFSYELKKSISGFSVLLGKLILARRLLKMKKSLSEDAVGGAILLGTKKPVIKAHGNSNPKALCNAILLAGQAAEMNLAEKIEKAVSNN